MPADWKPRSPEKVAKKAGLVYVHDGEPGRHGDRDVAVAHVDPEMERRLRASVEALPFEARIGHGVCSVMRRLYLLNRGR